MAARVHLGRAQSASQSEDDPAIYEVVIPLELIPMPDPHGWLQLWTRALNQQPGVDFTVERHGLTTIKIHVRAYEAELPDHIRILQHWWPTQTTRMVTPTSSASRLTTRQRRRPQPSGACSTK